MKQPIFELADDELDLMLEALLDWQPAWSTEATGPKITALATKLRAIRDAA